MTTNDKTDREASTTAVQPPLGCSIGVSFTDEGVPFADIAMAIVAPGDEIIWHTAPNERRPFTLLFRPRSSSQSDDSGTAAFASPAVEAATGSPSGGASQRRGAELVSVSSPGELTVASWSEQLVRIRIDPNTPAMHFDCILTTKDILGPAFTGGVRVQPPPRPK